MALAVAYEPYLGEITLFAGTNPPSGWAFCQGQILPIAQNTALFSILGTTYGGNGQTTFALPDLSGRLPLHPGQGPGLTNRLLGEANAVTDHSVVLTKNELPAHSHRLIASNQGAFAYNPTAALFAVTRDAAYFNGAGAPDTALGTVMASPTAEAHENMQPTLGLNFIIALSGIFPQHD